MFECFLNWFIVRREVRDFVMTEVWAGLLTTMTLWPHYDTVMTTLWHQLWAGLATTAKYAKYFNPRHSIKTFHFAAFSLNQYYEWGSDLDILYDIYCQWCSAIIIYQPWVWRPLLLEIDTIMCWGKNFNYLSQQWATLLDIFFFAN